MPLTDGGDYGEKTAGEKSEVLAMQLKKKVPSLVDLCIQTAIDNVRYLGDVGETDIGLLEQILPHCTVDQLMHIEESTKGRDLSPVTDKLWKKFYEKQFGPENTNLVLRRMKQKNVSFRWMKLYEAKLKDVEEAQNKSLDRIRQLYKKEDARKQSRQVQLCSKVPPSSNKRSWGNGPGYNVGNLKGNLMKKAKIEFLKRYFSLASLRLLLKSFFFGSEGPFPHIYPQSRGQEYGSREEKRHPEKHLCLSCYETQWFPCDRLCFNI
ncbi:hypothetical protein CDL15_Pgr002929 [Punica granatum]|uniref:Elongin-A n=1 Tax=Punica granatum TaxID=22663 RepID=A0A218X1Q2_PUNGR|nr:hypothetical protein CDL15_Pgr002929 [Punica granatum]